MNSEYKLRRDALFSVVPDSSIIILGSWAEQKLNDDVEYSYKQNPNLYYLSGWVEPESVIVLEKRDHGRTVMMFVRPKDPTMETWTGPRAGPIGAIQQFGADYAHDISSFNEIIQQRIKLYQTIYHDCPDTNSQEYKLIEQLKSDKRVKLVDLRPIIELHRVKKTDYEIGLIRQSCKLSAKAHMLAMRGCHPGMNERNLDALISGYLTWNGSKRLAYPNIVAAGNNATTLHYGDNNSTIKNNDLILIDAGGELDYYASDITRTFPANGKFTNEQLQIYQIVLNCQQACISYAKPGITLFDIHNLSCKVITDGLIKLGLLNGTVEENINSRSYTKFYMHSIGHWMGIDVHDCQTVDRKTTKLESGFVFTIEPGIYISNDLDVPDRYKGIGIRIEDDVVITASGCEVLTDDVPKQVQPLEQLVGTQTVNLFNF
jgi:Xaa-Pro aminopeptidase